MYVSHPDQILEIIIGALPNPKITAIKTSPDAVQFYWGFSRWHVDLNLHCKIVSGGSLHEKESSKLMELLLKKELELQFE